jgi:hypothetical protein
VLSCMDKEKVEELVETMRTLRESLLPRITKSSGNGKQQLQTLTGDKV